MSDVTVIIPTFNCERFLPITLRSLTAQTHSNWRAIVVDDGSIDGTAKLATAIDSRIELLRQDHQGVSSARNAGTLQAKTDYLLYLDADDLLYPDALSRLVQRLVQTRNAVAAVGTFDKILPDGSSYPGQGDSTRVRFPEGNVLESILRQNFLANGGHVLVRTADARRTGGFDTGLRLSEDWEFWCRLALQGSFTFLAGEPVMSLRVHPTSTSGMLSRDWTNHLPALERVKNNRDLTARFSASKWKRLEKVIIASHKWEAGRVNFSYQDFQIARRLMIDALLKAPTLKRLALLILAQVSQLLDRSLVSRLRFVRDDEKASYQPKSISKRLSVESAQTLGGRDG